MDGCLETETRDVLSMKFQDKYDDKYKQTDQQAATGQQQHITQCQSNNNITRLGCMYPMNSLSIN